MLKILQARLQQYMNQELPDVQAGFRNGRGTRCQIANIRWIIEEARVRTGHGTTDWFQIGKGVYQGIYCHPAYLTYMQGTS